MRDASGSAKYAGDDDLWELSEQGLVEALERHEMSYTRVEGEAAFYGPKIDIQVADAIGRRWQLTTVQVDFNLPERFDISYEDADGTRQRPVMVHRAIFGAMERFCGRADRALRGRVPGLAGAGAGGCDPDCGPARGVLRVGGRAPARGRAASAGGHARRAHEPQDPRRTTAEDAVHADCGGTATSKPGKVSVRLRTEEDLGAMTVDDFLAGGAPRGGVPRPARPGFGQRECRTWLSRLPETGCVGAPLGLRRTPSDPEDVPHVAHQLRLQRFVRAHYRRHARHWSGCSGGVCAGRRERGYLRADRKGRGGGRWRRWKNWARVRFTEPPRNLAEPGDVGRLFDQVLANLGAPDILVNNAAAQGNFPFPEMDRERWRWMSQVNLEAPFELSRRFVLAREGAGGAIVNVVTNQVIRHARGRVGYGSTKVGLVGLTRTMALELAHCGIRG